MIWKVFFSCSMGTFTLAICQSFIEEGNFNWSGTSLKFGSFNSTKDVHVQWVLPGALLIGIICGLLGAFFIFINTKVNNFRKVFIKKTWMKPVETMLFSMATSSLFFFATYLFRSCE